LTELAYVIEKETCLVNEPQVLVKRYAELIIQLGYITMFAVVFPPAPLFSLLCNLFEIKITINTFAYSSKRIPALSAKKIGNWEHIFSFLTMIAIPVNVALMFYTSDSLETFLKKDFEDTKDAYYMLGFAIALEHGIILLKMVLQISIADIPHDVKSEKKEQYSTLEEIKDKMALVCDKNKSLGKESAKEKM